MMKIQNVTAQSAPLNEKPSQNACPSCGGPLTEGEEDAGGVCADCYFKYSDHDSSTGE